EAVTLSKVAEDRVTEARALYGLATASLSADDLTHARSHVERALHVVESLRTEVENRDLRASYVASVYRCYETQIDLLMRLSKRRSGGLLAAAAFDASERSRARSLRESISAGGHEEGRSDADSSTAARSLSLKEVQQQILDADTLLLEYSLG